MSLSSLNPTFEQIPYSALISRIDNGSQGLFELTNLFTERKELEEKNVLHSAKVSRSNVYEYEINNSSCERVLGFFKNYHLFLSKAQVKHHKAFGEVIIKDLDDLKISRASSVNKHKVAVQSCLRDVTAAEDALDKAKKNYLKAKTDLERGKAKLIASESALVEAQRINEERRKENMGKDNNSKFSMGRMLSAFETTPEQERDKQQRKVDRRSSEVAMCLQQIIEKKNLLVEKISAMDNTLQKAQIAFQEAEHERIVRLKACMRSFCELERSAISARSELLTTLEEAIASQDADHDLALFIAQEKNVELTHKYTSAITFMDLHLKKSEEEISREQLLSDREEVSTNTALDDSVRIGDASVDAVGDEAVLGTDIDHVRPEGSTEDDHLITKSTEEQQQQPSRPKVEIGDEEDDYEVVNNPSGSSIASQGDVRLIHRMSTALASLFPATSSTNTTPFDSGKGEETSATIVSPSSSDLPAMLVTENEWREIIFFKPTRELFLQELDEQRGRRATLTHEGFQSMGTAMKVLLDYCDAFDDPKSAMRVTNMANTFHTMDPDVHNHERTASTEPEKTKLVSDSGETDDMESNSAADDTDPKQDIVNVETISNVSESKEAPAVTTTSVVSAGSGHKRYLQTESKLNRHHIWRKAGFWELALLEGIVAQMNLSEQPTMWDELSPDALREAVIGVHNIVFGQLCALSFAMHDLSLSAEEVESNILHMSRKAQLTEDQEHELVRSIRATYGIVVPPVKVLDEHMIKLVPAETNDNKTNNIQNTQHVRAVGVTVAGNVGNSSTNQTSQSAAAPIVVVGKVISSGVDNETSISSNRRPSSSFTSSSSGGNTSGSSNSVPPPLPPPLSPSHVSTSGISDSNTRKRGSGTAAVPNASHNSNHDGSAILSAEKSSETATTVASESSFMSYFRGSGSSTKTPTTTTGGATPNSSKTSSNSGKQTSKKPSAKTDDHDDFFAVL